MFATHFSSFVEQVQNTNVERSNLLLCLFGVRELNQELWEEKLWNCADIKNFSDMKTFECSFSPEHVILISSKASSTIFAALVSEKTAKYCLPYKEIDELVNLFTHQNLTELKKKRETLTHTARRRGCCVTVNILFLLFVLNVFWVLAWYFFGLIFFIQFFFHHSVDCIFVALDGKHFMALHIWLSFMILIANTHSLGTTNCP